MRSRQIASPISADEADQLFERMMPFDLVVAAVSGGPDSMALLTLLADWRKRAPGVSALPQIVVVTVDHQLRPEAADEARLVGRVAGQYEFVHQVLTWDAPKPSTGIMEAAREERYRLLLEFAESRACGDEHERTIAIVTAHHQDDQAETVLMRLARGSGVKGLSGMNADQALGKHSAVRLVRPFLEIPKVRLEATVRQKDVPVVDDPSNIDPRYERPRLRAAEAALNEAGIGAAALATTARRMRDAEDAINFAVGQLTDQLDVVRHSGVFVSVDRRALCAAPRLLKQRMLEKLIDEVRGLSEPATLAEVERLVDTIASLDRGRRTLAGTEISWGRRLCFWRELGRLTETELPLPDGASAVWDGRFLISRNGCPGVTVVVRPLGPEGLKQIRDEGWAKKTAVKAPARAFHAVPSFWVDGQLAAAPQCECCCKSRYLTAGEQQGLEMSSIPVLHS